MRPSAAITIGLLLLVNAAAHAGLITQSGPRHFSTSGGGSELEVNWLDTRANRPIAVEAGVPVDDTPANEYWIDLSSGTGSTCSQGSPCDSFDDLAGKTTTNGTSVYVKGNGRINVTSGTFAGAADAYVHIQPWPSDSTPTVLTATGGCTISAANQISSTGWSRILVDGGPDMLIRFVGSGCTGNQNGYTLVVNSNDVTLYRVRIDANDSGGPGLGSATNADTDRLRFVNSELYNAGNYYGVYIGGGTSCPGGTNDFLDFEFRNSIFRDIDGRGIQIEPRADSSGMIIDGNSFDDVGYNDSGNMTASGAVQAHSDACGATSTGYVVTNNLMWNLGGGCVLAFEPNATAAQFLIVNNSCWDFGNSGDTPSLNFHGMTSLTDGDEATARNNIVVTGPGGVIDAFNRASGWVTNDNLCDSGEPCGSNSLTGSAATVFDSTSTASSDFLKPAGNALNNCLVISGVETDYFGNSRGSVGAATDCGAINEP